MTDSLAAAAALLVETLPGGVLEFAWTFLAMLLASGLATSVVSSRADRRRQRADTVRADADRAFDALMALRAATRRRDEQDYDALLNLGDVLDVAAQRVSAEVARAAAAFSRASVVSAVDDEDMTATDEREAYDALVAALVRARNAFR